MKKIIELLSDESESEAISDPNMHNHITVCDFLEFTVKITLERSPSRYLFIELNSFGKPKYIFDGMVERPVIGEFIKSIQSVIDEEKPLTLFQKIRRIFRNGNRKQK